MRQMENHDDAELPWRFQNAFKSFQEEILPCILAMLRFFFKVDSDWAIPVTRWLFIRETLKFRTIHSFTAHLSYNVAQISRETLRW